MENRNHSGKNLGFNLLLRNDSFGWIKIYPSWIFKIIDLQILIYSFCNYFLKLVFSDSSGAWIAIKLLYQKILKLSMIYTSILLQSNDRFVVYLLKFSKIKNLCFNNISRLGMISSHKLPLNLKSGIFCFSPPISIFKSNVLSFFIFISTTIS